MLKCAVCLYLTGNETRAITVANGQAVCEEHFVAIKRKVSTTAGPVALSMLYRQELDN